MRRFALASLAIAAAAAGITPALAQPPLIPDSDIALAGSGPTAPGHGLATYTYTVTNNGPDQSRFTSVPFTLGGVRERIVGASSSQDVPDVTHCVIAHANGAVCFLDAQPLGDIVTLTITVSIDPDAATGERFVLHAVAADLSEDRNPTNNMVGIVGQVS